MIVLTAAMALIVASSVLLWLGVAFALYSLGESLFMLVLNDIVTLITSAERRRGLVSVINVARLNASVVGSVFFVAILLMAGTEILFGTTI